MNLKYRPEIDGLRAIAVGAVIFYHAQISLFGKSIFSGGYIGVDIFFVISGYLISTIIFQEIRTTDAFSFNYFYERRIRRIIPVLLMVILISTILGWIFLTPSELLDFSKSAISSIFFGSNFYFHYSGLEYGAVDGLYQPLLHTWSLSVEEQYYILFPIILFLGFKFLKGNFIKLLILFFFLSLITSQFAAQTYPSSNFYFIYSRVWELMSGTLLAYFETKNGIRSNNKILSNIASIIGILLITHSIFFFNDKVLHPSFLTIFPIVGTCLIIWFSNNEGLITKILSSKIFVGVGLISYSLYLWHYPIFAFARINNIFHGELLIKVILGIFILSVSTLSYFIIEKPFRNKNISFKKISIILISKIIIILAISIYVIQKNGVESRIKSVYLNQYDIDFSKKLLNTNKEKNTEKLKIVFFGDSTIASLVNYTAENYSKEFEIYDFTSNGCLFIRNFTLERLELKNIYKKDKGCDELANKERIDKIKKLKNFYVVYGGMMPVALTGKYFSNSEINNNLSEKSKLFLDKKLDARRRFVTQTNIDIEKDIIETINFLSNLSNKLYLIYPFPELGFDPNFVRGLRKIEKTKNLTISKELYLNRIKQTEKIYKRTKIDKIKSIYPENIFCKFENRCISTNKDIVLYGDDSHLSNFGVTLVFNKIIEDLNLSN